MSDGDQPELFSLPPGPEPPARLRAAVAALRAAAARRDLCLAFERGVAEAVTVRGRWTAALACELARMQGARCGHALRTALGRLVPRRNPALRQSFVGNGRTVFDAAARWLDQAEPDWWREGSDR